jgi:aryl-alcohol dehydrogenase-like predicted oxidoreductase
MPSEFSDRPLGNTGISVTPLGISASYLPGRQAIHAAFDAGVSLFFSFGFDVQMTRVLRELTPAQRDRITLASGAYNYVWWQQDVRKALEKRLRQFRTDHIDIFLFLGVMKPAEFTPGVREELLKLREEGKVRAVGISCHNRKFLGELARQGDLDVLMLRYNAAHRGAEQDIFPHLASHNRGVISYTATRWTYLLRRPKSWPIWMRCAGALSMKTI